MDIVKVCFLQTESKLLRLKTVASKVGYERGKSGAKVIHFCALAQEESTRTAAHIYFYIKTVRRITLINS